MSLEAANREVYRLLKKGIAISVGGQQNRHVAIDKRAQRPADQE